MEKDELGLFVLFPTEYLEKMTCRQAVLMGMLIGMAKKQGYAYPSNKTIGQILNMTTTTVQRELQILEEGGFLVRQIIRDANQQVISRRIYPKIGLPLPPELGSPLTSNLRGPSPQICNNNKDNTISINKDIVFEELWSLYQKKGIKSTAKKSFMRLSNVEVEALQTFIPKYIKNHEGAGKMDYIPHFSTFLNQKRWHDELPYKIKIDPVPLNHQNIQKFNLEDYD
jgi:hypothetical protein